MAKEKKIFFIRLIPPRPEFAMSMSEEEKILMQEHIVYWQHLLRKKMAFAFGPVFDKKGGYGIGILEVENDEIALAIMEQDPTIRAGRNFTYEIHPMRLVKK
jgi:hypothetical protein